MSKNAAFRLFPTVRAGYRPDSDFSTDASGLSEAGTASVTMSIKGTGPAGETTETTGVELDIYGPGEVTNVDSQGIVRMEPEPDTTAFPPNYFPLVEFDDPQLPWLFSPTSADEAGRNHPWLCLAVVRDSAAELKPPGTGPLPVLEVPTKELPDPSESWAWAHAQLLGGGDPESEFEGRSTRTKSRLLCPRNLSPQTKYRACVVPTFEPGRRAGLGLDPYPEGESLDFAWSDDETVRIPVYHHWTFTSAAEGDFESLARELDPVTFEGDVGFRTVDVSDPGPEKLKPESGADTQKGTVGVGGALKAIGAEPDGYGEQLQSRLRELLNTPNEVTAETDYGAVGPPLYGQWHAGVSALEPPSADGPTYYYPAWFNQLNADPRHRIAAGYGTQVVQNEQEALMAAAWEQFGEIQAANRKLRRMQLAREVQRGRTAAVESLSTGSLLGLTAPIHGALLDEELGETVHSRAVGSDLPDALSSPAFRRITRSTGPLARRTGVSLDTTKLMTRLESGRVPRLSDGLEFTVDAAPADAGEDAVPTDRDGRQSGDRAQSPLPGESGEQFRLPGGTGGQFPADGADAVEESFRPGGSPVDLGGDGRQARPLDGTLPGDDGESALPPSVERVIAVLDSLDAHVGAAERRVDTLQSAIRQSDGETVTDLVTTEPTVADRCASIGPDTFAPLSRRLSKLLTEPRPDALPSSFDRASASARLQSLHAAQRKLDGAIADAVAALRADPTQPRRARDALDRAKAALSSFDRTSGGLRSALAVGGSTMQTLSATVDVDPVEAPPEIPELGAAGPTNIELPSKDTLRSTVLEGIDPAGAIHEHAADVLGVPDLRYREDPVESVMAAPTFDHFTYELLAELNQEYFLPGVGQIPKNSMGVLQTNPEFVEAFMTGLNHEMARELQWRRYPTDRKGTYFRRFWNRLGNPETDQDDPEAMADIEPIHTWDQNDLGENSPGDDDAQVVLLIRGELLRRYPNTDIFAAKAVAEEGTGPDGETDRIPALPGTHVTRDDASGDADLKFPVFRGRLDPDVTFFGFDLSPDEALYDPYHTDSTADPDDHADEGWFFVLQEPPAETRFGMDVGGTGPETPPPGISHDGTSGAEQIGSGEDPDAVEHGWSALSWAHLVDSGKKPGSVTHVDVDGSRPGRESWSVDAGTSYVSGGEHSYDDRDAATWGHNSAHMARATWQRPVRISVHADDMITEDSAETWRVTTIPGYTPVEGGEFL